MMDIIECKMLEVRLVILVLVDFYDQQVNKECCKLLSLI
jgi:hypothetical protein